jgi:hypothetical protein
VVLPHVVVEVLVRERFAADQMSVHADFLLRRTLSESGTKRTSKHRPAMSGFGGKADITQASEKPALIVSFPSCASNNREN